MSMKGKVVVFTGKCSLSRAGMKKEAEEHGMVVRTGITSKTDYLVSGDQIAANATGSKYKKAAANDVTILHEDEYRALLTGKSSKKESTKKTPAKKKTKTSKKKITFDWIGNFKKVDLILILKGLNDTTNLNSATRSDLISKTKTYPVADVINTLSADQCEALLFSLRFEYDAEESLENQRKRLQESL